MPRRKPQPIRPPKRHERARGDGTVREVRPGVWRAERARTVNAEGKTVRQSKTFSGEGAAVRSAEWAKGTVVPEVYTLGHWLADWLDLVEPTISINTYKLYRASVRACEPLKDRPLAALTVAEWQTLTNSLLKRWSRYHVYVWRGNISTALRAAIPDHLTANPLQRVNLPKAVDAPTKAWTQAEVDRLLATVEGTVHEAWVLFSLGTGVRLGEARALEWTSLDWPAKTATISRNMDNSTNRIGPTKTGKIRVVDVPDDVMAFLRTHQMRQAPGQKLVFGHKGGAYRPSTLREWLARRCVEAGIRPLPPHAMRHTYASLSIVKRVPITDIARQLGHTVQTCMRIYSHWLADGARRAATAMGEVLRNRFSGPKRDNGASIGARE